jgi:hypothetical protein
MADLKELVDKVLDELELESVTGGRKPEARADAQDDLGRKLLRPPAREMPISRK